MRNLGREYFRIPIPVYFQGFEADTVTLMQRGWDISVDRDVHRNCFRFALRLRSINMYAISDDFDFEPFFHGYIGQHRRYEHPAYDRPAPIRINHIASEIEIRQYGGPAMNFNPLADPNLYVQASINHDGRYYITKQPWFETIEKEEDNTIFFEGHEVPDLLAGILKKQEAKQKEIREKLRKATKQEDYQVDVSAKVIRLR